MQITRRAALLSAAAVTSIAAPLVMAEHLNRAAGDTHLEALHRDWIAANGGCAFDNLSKSRDS